MDIILVIIISIMVFSLVFLLIYNFLRFLKGSIKINLNGVDFFSGSTISGRIKLNAKKNINSNSLKVSIIGTKLEKKSGVSVGVGGKGNNQTKIVEVYREDISLEGSALYNRGLRYFEFKILTPYQENVFSNGASLFNNTQEGNIISSISFMGGGKNKYPITWRIEAYLDAEGVDLSNSVNINVNLKPQSQPVNQ